MKKILVVDDSALMRSVLCDIISKDERFEVADRAVDGLEALDFLSKNTYDAVVLDVNMPRMNGLDFLRELRKRKIAARVMMASTDTREGAKVTLDALDLGAIDFVHKPDNPFDCRDGSFSGNLLDKLEAVANSRLSSFDKVFSVKDIQDTKKVVSLIKKSPSMITGNQIVAIASSTGGPTALQHVIPRLPKGLKAPVVVVQHMPRGFTKSLAERLDSLSELKVKEAEEGDVLEPGCCYIAMGGMHLNVDRKPGGRYSIRYSDEPAREGVKPCANYMYESLATSSYDRVFCVVLTGMGADGTKGIKNLLEKKPVHVIAQTRETCTVYGMPRSIVEAGIADQIIPLDNIAQEIILGVGVN